MQLYELEAIIKKCPVKSSYLSSRQAVIRTMKAIILVLMTHIRTHLHDSNLQLKLQTIYVNAGHFILII